MLATLFVASLLGFQDPTPPPRPERPLIREVIDGGGIILIDRRPEEKTISIVLTASARGVEERAATHGWRHLLEHLAAKGRTGNINRPLETAKWFMSAQTTRDVMQFNFEGPAGSIAPAIAAIEDILTGPSLTQELISKEVGTIYEEAGIAEAPLLMSDAAWAAAFGDGGLSPIGSMESLAKATPADLDTLFKRHFARDQLVVSIVGPVDPNPTLNAVELALAKAPPPLKLKSSQRGIAKPGLTDAANARGSAISAIAPGMNDIQCIAIMAAGLALAGELDEPFFSYEPTLQSALVSVGSTSQGLGEIRTRIDEAIAHSPGRLWASAQLYIRLYVAMHNASPRLAAEFAGTMNAQPSYYRVDSFKEFAEQLTFADFSTALQAFGSSRAVGVAGGRR